MYSRATPVAKPLWQGREGNKLTKGSDKFCEDASKDEINLDKLNVDSATCLGEV